MAAAKSVTCAQYTLTVDHTPGKFEFALQVVGDNGNDYFLQVTEANDRPGLVVDALQAMAKVWPSFAFKFRATGKRITEFL
jgi:hypothetical protein